MAKPRKVGNKWKMEVRRKGVHKYGTFNTKSEAIAWGKETTRLILGGAVEYSREVTFNQAAKLYLDEVATLKKGWRWEDIRIKKFLNDGLGGHTLFNMTSKFFKEWIAGRLNEVSPSSVNRELNLLSAIFEHAKESEITDNNPIRGIKRPKNPKHRERVITENEIDLIVSELGLDSNMSKGQTGIAFLLAIETGMRRGELLSLNVDDVLLDQSYAIVRDSKNGDRREVPLSNRAVDLFKMLDGAFTVSPETLSQLFRKCCRKIGVAGVTFHDTRHLATIRLSKKLSVLDLARVLGHRDLKSLMIYYNESASNIAKKLG